MPVSPPIRSIVFLLASEIVNRSGDRSREEQDADTPEPPGTKIPFLLPVLLNPRVPDLLIERNTDRDDDLFSAHGSRILPIVRRFRLTV